MKTPTTPFSIAVQNEVKITREFLLSKGWILNEEKPLFETFKHSKNSDLVCSIGLYGEFSIALLHWCNKTPDRCFETLNPKLTTDDYEKILTLLNIEI